MSSKKKLHYDLHEWEERADCLSSFIKVRAWDDEGHEVSIITNRAGEGEWIEVREAGQLNYKQVSGTLQFKLARTAGLIRNQLRKRFAIRDMYGWND